MGWYLGTLGMEPGHPWNLEPRHSKMELGHSGMGWNPMTPGTQATGVWNPGTSSF